MAETKTSKRVIGVLSAIYFAPGDVPVRAEQDVAPGLHPAVLVKTAVQGQEVELVPAEEKRLEEAGALLPKGSKPEDAQRVAEARLDAYRAQRGDTEALARHQQRLASHSDRGDIVDVDAPVGGSVGDLAAYISETKPTVDDTVALADNDPDKARKVLEAENQASGGSPRAGVQERLSKIAEG